MRVIIVGLKKDNYSREMLLRLLTLVVSPCDSVLAVHSEEPSDTFDPNSFHIHEDICKSKQVDFQVKVCTGDSFVTNLINQVRLHHATMPKESVITSCLKGLPPTCSLLVIDTRGRVLLEKTGSCQQGSASKIKQPSCSSQDASVEQSDFTLNFSKQVTSQGTIIDDGTDSLQLPEPNLQKNFQKFAGLEFKGASRRFTPQNLQSATNNFSPQMVISECRYSKIYKADLGSGQAAAVKVLQITEWSGEDLLQEIEILSGLNHENIVKLIGYCYSLNIHAVVYNLLHKSLKQKLTQLRWSERNKVAVGIAKALEYLHHSCSPPIIHRDVRSSNILLSCHCEAQLSNFEAAIVHHHNQAPANTKKPVQVVESSAYLAPEYLMFGKVDEKIDVYSYGVVLLELITGKEATQDILAANQESLVLQARSLLSQGLWENLIDPHLNEDYGKEEMHKMIMAARLCLMHSSSRRPTMKTVCNILFTQKISF
ncbi:Proline-rich receptor-like protein kinase perk1 [Thalictrum thalictroides]|uniref:Proline-rich receptor-like protein kinase perk1 n=1 Tax=Thalictrum thalictroides TaxID=46969 RepID=A0A7J6WUW8_THATH|nr:Proline-rich receptor-like protein kinase perk1 [Thalictrum thalictroides]